MNGLTYDGVAFFANTRALGLSANIDNLAAGAGITIANIQTDLNAIRSTMRLFQDDWGRPTGLVPNVLVVPSALEQVFYQALNRDQGPSQISPVVPGGETAIDRSGYTVIVNPYLTDVTDWYALHVAGEIKPFVWQNRTPPSLEGITDPNTESGVIRDKFVYSVRARYNVGYGEPRHAIKVVNSG